MNAPVSKLLSVCVIRFRSSFIFCFKVEILLTLGRLEMKTKKKRIAKFDYGNGQEVSDQIFHLKIIDENHHLSGHIVVQKVAPSGLLVNN